MKVLFIDSGLGGLGVMAEVERLLLEQNLGAELIFANGLPSPNHGYNSMDTLEEKVETFNHVLDSLWKLYMPARIVIACNTLSVVYPSTMFAQKKYTAVDEIIGTGVNAIHDAASESRQSALLILGTPTTIESRVHESALLERGLAAGSVLSLPCKNLETSIQRDPSGQETRQAITYCMLQARKKLPPETEKLNIALCCTHYGFSESVFVHEAQQAGFTTHIINPNIQLARQVAEQLHTDHNARIPLAAKVVSGYQLRIDDIRNIGALLERKSPATAAALRNYELRRSLYKPDNDGLV